MITQLRRVAGSTIYIIPIQLNGSPCIGTVVIGVARGPGGHVPPGVSGLNNNNKKRERRGERGRKKEKGRREGRREGSDTDDFSKQLHEGLKC